ncbi:hypothetical protein CTEN210_06421 [Chaetoceros tenuissimus]|uniref:Sulfatase N-terminal domain-containing protein n=1 Tax=Chaetoceros tenuissimus TaxID=426638 RepID=A0AAD3CRX4_9STRA|nr:hypothetical protein CTEN210_06421 [Chaetoceros tenuissimus]
MRLPQLLLVLLLSSSSNVLNGKEHGISDLNNEDKRDLQQQKNKKPNILILLADDVGTSDIPYWGDNIVPMHNIQKLQSQGVMFMDAHASSICAPSRYMLLSGNYPHRGLNSGGTWSWLNNQNQFLNNQKSIAEVLKDQFNYHTGMLGKWHLGGGVPSGGTYSKDTKRPLSCCNIDWKKPMEDGPNDIGFDESFYTMGGIQSAPYSFFRNGYLQTDIDDIKFWEQGSYATVNDNGESIIAKPGEGDPNWDSTEYNTKLVKEVDNFLENHDTSDPFFLYVGLGPVHRPHSPVKFYLDGTPVAGTFNDPHLDMLYELDLVIGSMISSVEDRGLMDNTLVIFASDNGGIVKDIRHTNEFGRHFRGGKGTVWEGGHTIPMIMRYDGVLGAGEKRTGLVGLNDVYATLADIVGFDIPDGSAQDSISFADHALSEAVDSKREFFGIFHWPKVSYALRWGSFKYAVIHTSDTKKEEYLFNLDYDVKEERNLLIEGSQFHKRKKNQMATELRRLGLCPLDIEDKFLLTNGPDAGSRVTCNYFRKDKSRCEDQLLGELNCNSVCGRFRKDCKYYDNTWSTSYPAHFLSRQPSVSPTTIKVDTPTNDSCVNNPQYTFERNEGTTGNCNWLGENDVRKQRYCNDESIASECLLACDRCVVPSPTTNETPSPTTNETPSPTTNETPSPTTNETPSPTSNDSCVDNPQFTFERNEGTTGNCTWLGEKDVRIQRYCGDEIIASECSLTCDRCVVPSPTINDTPSSPTQSPFDPSCTNTPGFKFQTSGGKKECKWICAHKQRKVIRNRKRNNCQGEVKDKCCAACKALTGPRCAY